MPKSTLEQLDASLFKAKRTKDTTLQMELIQVQEAMQQPWCKAFRLLVKLLQQATSQVTKHYVADFLGEAKDSRVLKPLMQAAKAVENKGYSANFVFPCAEYDCTAYLNFFVQFLLTCKEPGEAMAGCVLVIEEMKGPFDSAAIRRHIAKLLGRDRNAIPVDLQKLDEVLTLQAAHALLDKYFEQVNRQWKSTF